MPRPLRTFLRMFLACFAGIALALAVGFPYAYGVMTLAAWAAGHAPPHWQLPAALAAVALGVALPVAGFIAADEGYRRRR